MRSALVALLLLLAGPGVAGEVEHRLSVELVPAEHRLTVTDVLRWREPPRAVEFDLHASLEPQAEPPAKLERIGRGRGSVPFERFRLRLPPGERQATLRYGGRIHHPLTEFGEGVGRRSRMSPGLIGEEGVYLGGASGWVPAVAGSPYLTFTLDVRVPEGWLAISQGQRGQGADGQAVRWTESHPQTEVYLVAGRFHLSRRDVDGVEALVYLREDDADLAARYLDATARYLELFGSLVGEYPYAKFALVANFWETGYGMPSFTLLGPRVLRLPFIIDSAYPHEIVHNWWGNGVYVDYPQGNWSEGLTAYMADHLLKERNGEGAEYRRDQLQKYTEYVSAARDFPLSAFTSRHSGASQAVGYGKGLMLFHMLRLRLGDAVFLEGLRRLYREHRFRAAGFADIRRSFEAVSGEALDGFFRHWVTRPGAPAVRLESAVQTQDRRVALTLTQEGEGGAYPLQVPIAFALADGTVEERSMALDEAVASARFDLPAPPVCVAVDPRFDLFRRLLPGELPVSLDSLLGAERLLLVLPSDAPPALGKAYRALAESWAGAETGVEIAADAQLERLPADRPVWLLGWENRFRDRVADSLPAADGLDAAGMRLRGERWEREGHSFVASATRAGRPLGWLASDDPAAVAGLARKVPHYGKYGYLVFVGTAPDNRLKGQWPASASPLVRRFAGEGPCEVPPRAALRPGAGTP